MMNFYCSEKEDKTNRFDSELGTRLRTNQNKTMAKPQNNAKHGEGHAAHQEAQFVNGIGKMSFETFSKNQD